MADDHNVSPIGQVEGARHIAGVRSRGSSRVLFFTVDDPEIEIGTWVLVTTSRGQEAARVVVLPHQVVLCQLEGDVPPVDRVLEAAEVEEFAGRAGALKAEPHEGERLIGGLGKSSRGGEFPASFSAEDEQYRKAKKALPRLGQRVVIAGEEGTIVSLQVFKHLVTVRYDDPEHEETYSADMLEGSVSPDDDNDSDFTEEG